MRPLLLICLGILLCMGLFGQSEEFMLLEKPNVNTRIKFKAGDQLKFRLNNSDSLYIESISAVFDTGVAFGNLFVRYPDIQKVWVYRPTFLNTTVKKFVMGGGILFFTLDTFNRLVNGDSPVITKAGLIALGTGLTIGGTIHFSTERWFRQSGKRQIRYLDLRMK